jgi:precorrin-4/cobalt-precorrin-4 C11-methyltransferase
LVPDTAEKHDSAGLNHREVMDLIRDARGRDLDVVRLHTGDPAIYGAIGEQLEELEGIGIETEVVPGVSAFQASAAALKWELTVPEVTQSIVLTRTPGRTPMPGDQSLEKFAETGSSLCLFLSVHGIREHAGTLAKHYGRECPAAVVYRASWPDEKIVRGTLGDIGEKTVSAGITRTALFLVRPWEKGKRSHLYDPEFSHGCRGKGG